MEKVDLAVVFYENEVDTLGLLAKSIELYCDTSLVDKIYLINNAVNPSAGRKAFDTEVLPFFDKFKDNVRIIDADKLGINLSKGANPYLSQQALKLSIATMSDKGHYLVLDAKCHFIRELKRRDLFNEDEKPVSHHQVHGGYVKACLKEACNYFDVDVDLDKPALPTVPPYLMITALVRDLLAEIEKREGTGIYNLISENEKLAEFLIYFAYLTYRGGPEKFYSIGTKPYATLFTKWPESDKDISRVLNSTSNDSVWMFSVRAKRFAQLKNNEIDFIANLWAERGLFDNKAFAKEFILQKGNSTTTVTEVKGHPAGDGKVVEGRNQRLFIANDSNDVIKQHRGEKILGINQIKAWRRVIETRKAVCSSMGAQYRLMVVPDAHAVHKGDLPQLDNIDAIRPIHQISSELYDYSSFIYPLEELINASEEAESYHPVDSHYTAYGAYVCYRRIMEDLKINIPILMEDDIALIEKEGSGDLGEKFNPPRIAKFTECFVKNGKANKIWNNGVTNRGHMSVWVNSDQTLPSCVLFTDSYGWKIQRFLAESFSRLYIVHSPLIEHDALDVFKPNVVISLMAERFSIYTPKDIFDKSALEFANEKGGDIKSYEEILSLSKV